MSSSSSDVLLPVDSSIKPPVFLHLGDTEPLSGVCVLDVTLPFGKTVNVEEISFKNHYTASVSVRLLMMGPPLSVGHCCERPASDGEPPH
ncbi:hypothetical protein CgunFtcFv8_015124 [Champsocephalus gunnari]|uniref:Uncharacterized protein n=1 Tax=Champsocephalus gunnari TaxID=52237 RepID=A0AAN8E817_CHAGU|nr:hypothetical protein CgunFtcFv8_015124 [Champsocephalus gunnari]